MNRRVKPASPPQSQTSRIPLRPYEPGEEAWYERASLQARAFFAERGEPVEGASLGHMVINLCADLAWSLRVGPVCWRALQVPVLWRRLEAQDALFPQPLLVLSFYVTLHEFVPWLMKQRELDEGTCARMLAELERLKNPLLERSYDRLAAELRMPSFGEKRRSLRVVH